MNIELTIVVLVLFYFLPTVLAAVRRKRNFMAIAALNLLLGWSVIGWIVALVWAFTHDKEVPE